MSSVHFVASQTFNNMANIKSITFFAFLSLGLISNNPAMGQQTRSVLDFWLTFGELLTTDVVNALTSVPIPPIVLPDFSLPALPSVQLPDFHLPNIQIPNIELPIIEVPVPTIQVPNVQVPNVQVPLPASSSSPAFDSYIKYLTQLSKLYQAGTLPTPAPVTPAPLTPAPVTAAPWHFLPAPVQPTQPCTNGCQPEKVKIIVVEDCDEKASKSSESSEESEEIDIVVPYTNRGRGRFQFNQKTNN